MAGGTGADSRDRSRLNGWAPPESPWSAAGAALEPEAAEPGRFESERSVPAWRRTGNPLFPAERPYPTGPVPGQPFSAPPSQTPSPPRFLETEPPHTHPSSVAPNWSQSRSRYADLVAPRENEPPEPTRPPIQRAEPAGSAAVPRAGESGAGGHRAAEPNPGHQGGAGSRPTPLRRVEPPTPASAPPYPYEGDLDEDRPVPPYRATTAVPLVRPAAPDVRRADWIGGEPAPDPAARHAQGPAPGPPRADPTPAGDTSGSVEPTPARPTYDPSTFPRRLGYEPRDATESSGYTPPPAYAGFGNRVADRGDQRTRVLPQRVPAEPDVPRVPEPPLVEPTAETPALARIATHLRRGDVVPAQDRQEGFDVQAILGAVREVDGVRDASLRSTPAGGHSLRLDLAEGADPAEVSRRVARLLQDRMGLDAAMAGENRTAGEGRLPAQSVGPAGTRAPGAPPMAGTGSSGDTQPVARSGAHPSAGAGLPAGAGQPLLSGTQRTGPAIPGTPSTGGGAGSVPGTGSTGTANSVPGARVTGGAQSPAGTQVAGGNPALPAAGARGSSPTLEPPRAGTPSATRPGPSAAGQATPGPEGRGGQETRSVEGRAGQVTAPGQPSRTGYADQPGLHQRGAGGPATETAVVPTGADPRPPRPLYPAHDPGPRIVIENVQVNAFGTDAAVEVRLAVGGRTAAGRATGPGVDGYVLRLCATATAAAVDQLLSTSEHPEGPVRCFVEHAGAVTFGASQVAVVVLLLSCPGWVEPLSGSAMVTGDDRLAMVRATLAAVNRRLEALLSG